MARLSASDHRVKLTRTGLESAARQTMRRRRRGGLVAHQLLAIATYRLCRQKIRHRDLRVLDAAVVDCESLDGDNTTER
jgi:hypothetical protein